MEAPTLTTLPAGERINTALVPHLVPIASLVLDPRNTRRHGERNLAEIAASYTRYGQQKPILYRPEDMVVVAGNGSVTACRSLGWQQIAAIPFTGTADEAKGFGVADNRTAELAEWDPDFLGPVLKELTALGDASFLVGWSTAELEDIWGPAPKQSSGPVHGEDDVPAEPEIPTSRREDVWLLEGHRLACGDSENVEDVRRLLGDRRPNLMVTDPPYGLEYDATWRSDRERQNGQKVAKRAEGEVINDDRSDWRAAWALFPGKIAYVWHDWLDPTPSREALVAKGFLPRVSIVWAKARPVVGRGHYSAQHETCWYAVRKGATANWKGGKGSTLWEVEHNKSESGHSTEKPVEVMRRPVINHTDAGDAVYDPFSGSGSTIIACETCKRVCYAQDKNPAHVDVAILRWQRLTGKLATLEQGGETFETVKTRRRAENPVITPPGEAQDSA